MNHCLLLALKSLFHLKPCFFFWVWVSVPPSLKHCFACWWRWSQHSIQAWSIVFLLGCSLRSIQVWSIELHSLLALESPFHPGLKHCCILFWYWSLSSIQAWIIALSAAGIGVSFPSRPELLLFSGMECPFHIWTSPSLVLSYKMHVCNYMFVDSYHVLPSLFFKRCYWVRVEFLLTGFSSQLSRPTSVSLL